MGLHGSIEVFGLTEVLGLLASAGQSGRLHVQGPGGDGSVWVREGSVVAATSARVAAAPASVPEAISGLMAERTGTFRFEPAEPAASVGEAGGAQPLGDVLSEATRLRGEWDGLLATCPDLDHRLRLVETLPGEETTIDADLWPVVTTVGAARPSVGELARALGLSELGALRVTDALLGLGLATLHPPAPAGTPGAPMEHVAS